MMREQQQLKPKIVTKSTKEALQSSTVKLSRKLRRSKTGWTRIRSRRMRSLSISLG